MKKWSFAFRVREWFLSPRHWDEFYEAGDSREVVAMFYADSSDIELAKKHLHEEAEVDDIKLEILKMEYRQEVEVEMPQKPIRK